jgi:redox-sensitive bicupin YhaK (pirin superfamily)
LKAKKVRQLLPAYESRMGDIPVYQPFPTQNVRDLDPFLLLHHHTTDILPGTHPRQAGVDPHPHRGFSAVTFVIKGQLYHQDSRGNKSTIGPGGIQWLDAGMGIIHSERPAKGFAYDGGKLELVQLWINLPERQKMSLPAYYECTEGQATKLASASGQSTIYLYSGSINGDTGPLKTYHPTASALIDLAAGDTCDLTLSEYQTTFLYLIDGSVTVHGFGMVDSKNVVNFRHEGDTITISGRKDSKVLLLSSVPIDEKYAINGPFVMQNETQLLEAMRDYKMGKMGFLVEEF